MAHIARYILDPGADRLRRIPEPWTPPVLEPMAITDLRRTNDQREGWLIVGVLLAAFGIILLAIVLAP